MDPMSFNLRKRNIFGPRFGEIMGKHCHAALTASNRKDRAAYDAEVATIYQMLDTIETETDWKVDAAETNVPKVAAEAKPVEESAGPPPPPESGAATAKRPSTKVPSANSGKKRTPSTKRRGVGSGTDTK